MQIILGSNGVIGRELAIALKDYKKDIRLVSRNPKSVSGDEELVSADLLNPNEMSKAVDGAEVVYVTIGFPYNHKVWKQNWPRFIANLISEWISKRFKLVFFDNIYMYAKECLPHMTEECKREASSKKGEIRLEVLNELEEASVKNNLKLCIARCADFYGPGIINNSVLTETVFKPLSEGKTANWLMSDKFKHSFTYTPDAGKALAILGNSEKAYGESWHLPTSSESLNGKEWVHEIAKAMNVKPNYRIASGLMVRLIGLFVPAMKESYEMLYQYDRDYVFDSSKFEKEFNFTPHTYLEGINEIVELDYSDK